MKPAELVVIGGSAGSLPVLLIILSSLTAKLNFAIVVVLHRKNTYDNALSILLSQKTSIPVKEIEDKDPIVPGVIYIAPADYHLLIETNRTFSLDYSERINYSRPAIDVTFETAALAYRDTLVAVLLSGANSDGTEGLSAVKDQGGTLIVQDPQTAEVAYMPQHALSKLEIDHVLKPNELGSFVNAMIRPEN